MDAASGIPVVDFSAYRLSLDGPESAGLPQLVEDVHRALTTVGFFYIVGTEFPFEKVSRPPDIRDERSGYRSQPRGNDRDNSFTMKGVFGNCIF